MKKLSLFIFLLLFCSFFGKERSSSYPYLSGDTWRFFCDWVLTEEEGFDPKKVKRGDTIFVEYGRLKRFSRNYLKKIKHPFILITPNAENGSDGPLPGPFTKLATSKKIAAWFLQNIDCAPNKKLIPLPIGLANRIWDHGDIEKLNQFIPIKQEKPEIFAYVNFMVGTNLSRRGPCFEYFQQKSWVNVVSPKPFERYLEDLTKTVFVISPPGNGLDCHRTWEALLMNCYPVVMSTTLNPLYENLPVVIVQNWSEVTEEFLQKKMEEFQSRTWSKEKLYADYWFQKVKEIQLNLRSKRFFLF